MIEQVEGDETTDEQAGKEMNLFNTHRGNGQERNRSKGIRETRDPFLRLQLRITPLRVTKALMVKTKGKKLF
jgi:hypothetical protein